MPKEIVVSHGPRLFDESGREEPQDRQGLVQVGWSAEAEHVQVVTLARDAAAHGPRVLASLTAHRLDGELDLAVAPPSRDRAPWL